MPAPNPLGDVPERVVTDLFVHLAGELCNYVTVAVASHLAHVDTNLVSTSPFMSVSEAAEHARCKPQRIYDLRSAGVLSPEYGDGSKALVLRSELDAYLRGGSGAPNA